MSTSGPPKRLSTISHRRSTPFFRIYQSCGTYAREARSDTLSELKKADLATWKRTVVYSFGASEGDRLRPKWRQQLFPAGLHT